MHSRDDEIFLLHKFSQLCDSFLCVAVDEGLIDVQIGIEVKKDVNFPFFFLDWDIVLMNTFESKFFIFHQNLCGVSHEMFS
jgi:hypothetical protein